MEFEVAEVNPEVKSFIDEKATEDLGAAIEKHGKHERDDAIDALFDRLLEEFSASYENNEIPADIAKEFKNYYHDLMKKMVRESILYKKNRPDGRDKTYRCGDRHTAYAAWFCIVYKRRNTGTGYGNTGKQSE